MRYHYTPEQVRMLVRRAERQLGQAIEISEKEAGGTHVARAVQAAVHDTVVSLTRLFRDQVPGAAEVATRIARAYAKGADARAGAPTLVCVRKIAELVREGRERYLPEAAQAG
ncbi:MAG TPA: hypothetical protein VF793_08795 [Telluria sp.]|jgi:hypothetical protein